MVRGDSRPARRSAHGGGQTVDGVARLARTLPAKSNTVHSRLLDGILRRGHWSNGRPRGAERAAERKYRF